MKNTKENNLLSNTVSRLFSDAQSQVYAAAENKNLLETFMIWDIFQTFN
jgi:hypothetical protein